MKCVRLNVAALCVRIAGIRLIDKGFVCSNGKDELGCYLSTICKPVNHSYNCAMELVSTQLGSKIWCTDILSSQVHPHSTENAYDC